MWGAKIGKWENGKSVRFIRRGTNWRYKTDGAPELVKNGKAIRFIDRWTNWRKKPAGELKPGGLLRDGLIGGINLQGLKNWQKMVKNG